MDKYCVKDIDIDHNGKRYPEGSEIELTAAQATKLKEYLDKITGKTQPIRKRKK